MTNKTVNTLTEIICGLDIFLFVYAALSKWGNHDQFAGQLSLFFHPVLGTFISILVPITELVIAGLLTILKSRKAGVISFTVLMGLFSLYIILLLVGQKHLPCHCGGIISSLSWRQHLVFNSFFIVMNLLILIIYKKKGTVSKAIERLKIIDQDQVCAGAHCATKG